MCKIPFSFVTVRRMSSCNYFYADSAPFPFHHHHHLQKQQQQGLDQLVFWLRTSRMSLSAWQSNAGWGIWENVVQKLTSKLGTVSSIEYGGEVPDRGLLKQSQLLSYERKYRKENNPNWIITNDSSMNQIYLQVGKLQLCQHL